MIKPSDTETAIVALQAMGFTAYEAKAYSAMVRLGAPAKGYEIARAANVPTSKIYEALQRLTEKGAVVFSAGDPATYTPVPYQDLAARLRDRTREHLETIENVFSTLQQGGDPSVTWIVAGADNVRDLMTRIANRAQRSIAAVVDLNLIPSLGQALRAASERAVDVRLTGDGNASPRVAGEPSLTVLIRDDTEAVAVRDSRDGAEAIWSENAVFVLLCREYAIGRLKACGPPPA